jgi:4-hydroxyphenylacetate 3-hydroxylase N terminal
MGACTGSDFLARIRDGREVWLRGERVPDVTAHPALGRGAATLARLLDRQHEPATRDLLTYELGGERYAVSFLMPRSVADVERRGAALYDWARWSNGMLGRTPDYLNGSFWRSPPRASISRPRVRSLPTTSSATTSAFDATISCSRTRSSIRASIEP